MRISPAATATTWLVVLQVDVESHGRIVCSVVKLCEKVVRSAPDVVGNYDAVHASRVACNLERRWHHLYLRALEWQCHLEALLNRLNNKTDTTLRVKRVDLSQKVAYVHIRHLPPARKQFHGLSTRGERWAIGTDKLAFKYVPSPHEPVSATTEHQFCPPTPPSNTTEYEDIWQQRTRDRDNTTEHEDIWQQRTRDREGEDKSFLSNS
uniref:Uncharacterized protein n=1 Tax=Timema cristinae TaxID=61476 RepID=A0A7R9GRZ8_TIMCR|nr:unnamed protein product [Timema cristinae]